MLVFRRSCQEGIYGSCMMSINGVNTVACLSPMDADVLQASMITIDESGVGCGFQPHCHKSHEFNMGCGACELASYGAKH
jgi:hypothetical protein